MKPVTLNEIARLLGCTPPANGGRLVASVASLADAGPEDLSVVSSDRYAKAFARTAAMAVIAGKRVRMPASTKPVFRVDDAEAAVSVVLQRFAIPHGRPAPGVDGRAIVAASATIAATAAVAGHVSIGERSSVGARAILHPGVVLGDDVSVGEDTELFPNVVVRDRVSIGSRVIIFASSVIGTDGFGYRWDGARHAKIPHVGTVVIEDDVELGSCVCVDRAKFGITRVGRGTKVDNLVQIAHNVQIGEHCVIVAQTGIAGSSKLGRGVVLGGQTAVRDHLTIGDGAVAAARTAIAHDLPAKAIVSGTPALPHRQSLREQAAFRRLPELIVQMRRLQEEVTRLKAKQADRSVAD